MRASITLRSEDAELARLQAFAAEFVRQCRLPDDERSRVLIVLEELFTNVITHGYGPQSTAGTITVALMWGRSRLHISFVDDAPPFDPLAVRTPDLDTAGEERSIGGLGIHIVRSLVDQARYCYRADRNHLHLIRHIARAPNNPN